MKRHRIWLSGICAVACLNGAMLRSQDVPANEPANAALELVVQEVSDGTSEPKPVIAAEAAQVPELNLAFTPGAPQNIVTVAPVPPTSQGKYWIGLVCVAPSDALRTQLDLAADMGLLVEEVTDDAPAMKAGIQKHDLLLSVTLTNKPDAQPQTLKNPAELTSQIQVAELNPVKIEFLRRGRKQVLEVVPAERPKSGPPHFGAFLIGDDNQILRLSNTAHAGGIRFLYAGPMVVQPAPPLPEGVSIDYEPAQGPPEKVTVKKGDQTWTVTPNELNQLPEDLRGIVQQHIAARQAPNTSIFTGASGTITLSPADFSITFSNEAGKPAGKIAIKRGEQSWEVNDTEFSKLPEDLQRMAETSLRSHLHAIQPPAVSVTSTESSSVRRTWNHGPGITVHAYGNGLPSDVTVTVVRHGNDPAVVTVKKGDQSWEATEKDLTKLPGEFRQFAESSLRGPGLQHGIPFHPVQTTPIQRHVIPHQPAGRTTVTPFTQLSTPVFQTVVPSTMPEPNVPTTARPGAEPLTARLWKPGSTAPGTTPSPKDEERATIRATRAYAETNQREIERQLKELTEQVAKLRQAVEKMQAKP